VAHHAVADDDDLVEATEDLTDFLCGEPAHVAAARHVGGVVADAAAPGHGVEHVLARLAQGREGEMQIETADVARVAVLVGGKGIHAVGGAIVDELWGSKGNVRDLCGVVASIGTDQVGWFVVLARTSRQTMFLDEEE